MYSYIAHIDNTTKFMYIVLGLLIILLAHRLSLTSNTVIGVVLAILLAYYLNEKDLSLGNNYLTEMAKILHRPVFKGQYLYRDSELLIFLENHRHLRRYNPALFNTLVRHVDNFLRLGKDLGSSPPPENFNMDFENMLAERTKVMNAFHALVYALPHAPTMLSVYQNGMERLSVLLDTNIRDARHHVMRANREKGINVSSKFFYKGHPEAVDRSATGYNYFP